MTLKSELTKERERERCLRGRNEEKEPTHKDVISFSRDPRDNQSNATNERRLSWSAEQRENERKTGLFITVRLVY